MANNVRLGYVGLRGQFQFFEAGSDVWLGAAQTGVVPAWNEKN